MKSAHVQSETSHSLSSYRVLDRYAETPLRDAFWDALVCAEDAPNPPPGVLVRGNVAKRLDVAPRLVPPIAVPPVLAPALSTAAFQAPTSAYAMEVWPPFLRSRTSVHCMPAVGRRLAGECVICWCIGAPRLAYNLAFALARHTARALQLPLVVAMSAKLPEDLAAALCNECEWHSIPLLRLGLNSWHTDLLAMKPRICFVDEPVTRASWNWVMDFAEYLTSTSDAVCPFVGVSTHTLMPLRFRHNQYADIFSLMPDWQAACDLWRANVDWLALPPRRASIDDVVSVEGDLLRVFESAQLCDAELSVSRAATAATAVNNAEIVSVDQWMRSVAHGGVDRTMPLLRRALARGRISIYEVLECAKMMRQERHPLLTTLGPEFEFESFQMTSAFDHIVSRVGI
jgi:hypothetical protein